MEPIVFGPFRVDWEAGRLFRDGVELGLRPQAFHALGALIHNRGRFIDYEQMIREAWAGTTVSRHTVAVTVGEVKKALREYGSWVNYRPKHGYCLEVPGSEELLRTGWHLFGWRTRDGLEKALDCFEQAAAANRDRADHRPFEGIASCYITLGSYGILQPADMYARFLEAHGRAVAVAGMTTQLRLNRAFGLHMFERRFAEAEEEVLRALHESPESALAYVRLAMVRNSLRRFDEALEALKKARAADPLLPVLWAVEVGVHFYRRDYESAVECAKQAIQFHPYFPLGRMFYAQALEYSGRSAEALEQYRLACALAPDLPWLQALQAACLARLGRRGEALEILLELEHLRSTGYVDAYYMAALQAALGNERGALQELEQAMEETSPSLTVLESDPKMDALRGSPQFERLRQQVFCARELALVEQA